MDQPAAKRATWRLDARLRYRMQGIVVALICLLLALALWPQFTHLRETRDLQVCETNLRKISHALQMYTDDWDKALPPGPTWMTNIAGNMTSTTNSGFSVETYFHCPKDHTGSGSSYCYNDVLAGINPKLKYPKGDSREDQRLKIGNSDRMPLIFEKHGSEANGHLHLFNYEEFFKQITLAHDMPEKTGVMITGAGSVERRNEEQLQTIGNRKF